MVFLSPDLTLPGVYPQIRLCAVFGARLHPLWEARLFVCLFKRLYLLTVYFFLNLYCAGRGAHRQGSDRGRLSGVGKPAVGSRGSYFSTRNRDLSRGSVSRSSVIFSFALFVVVRRDRIGFSGVRVPQFEPFFAAQGDLFARRVRPRGWRSRKSIYRYVLYGYSAAVPHRLSGPD